MEGLSNINFEVPTLFAIFIHLFKITTQSTQTFNFALKIGYAQAA